VVEIGHGYFTDTARQEPMSGEDSKLHGRRRGITLRSRHAERETAAMNTTRRDKLRAEIARLRDSASNDTKWTAQYLRELTAASAELAGIEGEGGSRRWHHLSEIAAELGIRPSTLRDRIRESGIKPAYPGRGPMLSEDDVQQLMIFCRSLAPKEDTPARRPPPRKPKRPLTREEQGRRISEGKEQARRIRAEIRRSLGKN
jgi:hypothetical protein